VRRMFRGMCYLHFQVRTVNCSLHSEVGGNKIPQNTGKDLPEHRRQLSFMCSQCHINVSLFVVIE
jgi:ribosomal protein L44E